MDKHKIQEAIRMILVAIGEDPEREGLRDTPRRVADMYEEIFSGVNADPAQELVVHFNEDHEEMVIVKDIPFYSICEHHLLPFIGRAHIAYLPKKGRLTGLSKLARVAEHYAKRPQLQERLTSQIADLIMAQVCPHGVLVVVEAEHLCLSMRGIKKPGHLTITSAVRGLFLKNDASRAEAMSLLQGRR
ncbi:MAG TPA: GTP cyclohydrolase I FolE [Firmicutes bacterium]|nr:GTP cyclohydrolase I FolE [Bacillota bacterium]